MWAEVFAELRQGCPSDEAEIARAERELGFPLPESYRSFCRACGAGLAGGRVRVATPLPYPAADLVVRAELIAHSIQAAIGLLDTPPALAVEGDDPGVLDRACFFGETDDGHFLFWDVAGEPEYDIWLLAPDLETVRFGGESLDALFRRLQGAGVRTVLGEAAEPLPAVFEGIEAAVLARGAEAS
ncbi:SMI1/KNR4 family protein [Methylobacterium hispanicum]|uniref:SMI1/KNR4 family protein n=1 Tax=Methylobacterium hispanicum TaxID=270350 RepID=UPI002F2D2F4C